MARLVAFFNMPVYYTTQTEITPSPRGGLLLPGKSRGEKALSKQLRLEVAELTDIGRRRDSNEDNMTRLIPKDPRVMERKGAIFVVADGMGGHAAGEVASEIAVETVREEYYAAESDEVMETLLHAIKQANQMIYDRATEQAGRAGMGTTCVAVVTRGSLAYVANVGDSRVYLIRDGQMSQLTHDHSWVAEQVRAGMLTNEQARSHAHRNVITRALGTQPEVEVDVFVEPLRDGDLLLLCTDGLSGLVPDPEMNRIISSSTPQEAVRALITQANEQGGPDNITALLIHVLEAPSLAPEMQEQLATITDLSKERTVGLKSLKKPRKRLSPVTIALRTFAAVAVLFISLAAWDYAFGPSAWTRAAHNQLNADLNRAQTLVAQAQQEPPPQAVDTLAAAQHPLLNDLHNSWLSSDDHQRVTTVLQQVVGPAIRQALQNYNTLALVKPLSTLQKQSLSVSCSAASNGQIDQLVAVPTRTPASNAGGAASAGMPILIARAHSTTSASAAYVLNVEGSGTSAGCGAVIDPSVVDLATDGSSLYLLHEESATSFTIEQMAAAPNAKPQPLLTLPQDAKGALPTLLAVRGTQKYVLYRGTAGDTIYFCSGKTKASCAPMAPSPLPAQAYNIAAGPHDTLYLLLVDGSIGVLTPEGLHPASLESLLPVLPVGDPDSFSPMTSLPNIPATPTFSASPTPTPPGSTATVTPSPTPTSSRVYTPQGVKLINATVLISDQQNRLFIGDGADHRIIRLDVPATGTGDPMPSQQYADASALDNLLSVAAVDTGPQSFSLYALSGHTLLVMTLP
jgi:serine/threonine protein phosphatase PrpC